MTRFCRMAAAGAAALVLAVGGAAFSQEAGGDGIPVRQHIRLGDEREAQGNYLGAAFQYELAVAKDPENLEAYYKLAEAYTRMGLTYSGYLTRAEEVYQKILPRVGSENAEFRKRYAGLLQVRWEVDDAIVIFEELVTESPDNCEYWSLLGNAERAKAMQVQGTQGLEASVPYLEEAQKTYRRAMELCPDEFEPVHGLARVLDSSKRYQEVVDLYREKLDRYPENADMLRGYAYAVFNARDWAAAADAFGKLIELDPRLEDRLPYMAALRKLDRLDEFEEQSRIYQAAAPKYHGPEQLLPADMLREDLGIREASEQAVSLINEGRCDEAVALWEATRERTRARLDDPEVGSAAEELLVWLDRRILYAQGACK